MKDEKINTQDIPEAEVVQVTDTSKMQELQKEIDKLRMEELEACKNELSAILKKYSTNIEVDFSYYNNKLEVGYRLSV